MWWYWIWWFWNSSFFIEIASLSLDCSILRIGEIEGSISIESEAGGGAVAVKVWSWDVWKDDGMFISGEDFIEFRLGTGECELSTFAPVLYWSPLWIDKKMFGDGDQRHNKYF